MLEPRDSPPAASLPALDSGTCLHLITERADISCSSLSVSSFCWFSLYSCSDFYCIPNMPPLTLGPDLPTTSFLGVSLASRVNRVLSHLFSVSIYTPPKILWLGKHGVSSLSSLQIKNSKAPISVFFLTLPLINLLLFCSVLLSKDFSKL